MSYCTTHTLFSHTKTGPGQQISTEVSHPHTSTFISEVFKLQIPRLSQADWEAYLDIVINGNGDDVRRGRLLRGGVELRNVGVP